MLAQSECSQHHLKDLNPRRTVLEAVVLPLHQGDVWVTGHQDGSYPSRVYQRPHYFSRPTDPTDFAYVQLSMCGLVRGSNDLSF